MTMTEEIIDVRKDKTKLGLTRAVVAADGFMGAPRGARVRLDEADAIAGGLVRALIAVEDADRISASRPQPAHVKNEGEKMRERMLADLEARGPREVKPASSENVEAILAITRNPHLDEAAKARLLKRLSGGES